MMFAALSSFLTPSSFATLIERRLVLEELVCSAPCRHRTRLDCRIVVQAGMGKGARDRARGCVRCRRRTLGPRCHQGHVVCHALAAEERDTALELASAPYGVARFPYAIRFANPRARSRTGWKATAITTAATIVRNELPRLPSTASRRPRSGPRSRRPRRGPRRREPLLVARLQLCLSPERHLRVGPRRRPAARRCRTVAHPRRSCQPSQVISSSSTHLRSAPSLARAKFWRAQDPQGHRRRLISRRCFPTLLREERREVQRPLRTPFGASPPLTTREASGKKHGHRPFRWEQR
jgi:hypothetical protein